MQLISLLLALFAISCFLYGISVGVQGIQRGWNYIIKKNNKSANTTFSGTTDGQTKKDNLMLKATFTDELKVLFDLYQTGALTHPEYEQCKKHVLSIISNP